MRLKILACETLFREVYLAAAAGEHICDIMFLPRECHDDLALMRRMLQCEVDRTNRPRTADREEGVKCPACTTARHDAVVLAMGLCGNTTQGLTARDVPLVLPRVHDCHGLLLGGNERYLAEEKRTVFYHQGAVETLGAARVDCVPRRLGLGRSLDEYVRQYGEENGRYIYETEYSFARYNERALFLHHDGPAGAPAAHCRREVAGHVSRFGWRLDPARVEMDFIVRLLGGRWGSPDIIVVKPGETVDLTVTMDGRIEWKAATAP